MINKWKSLMLGRRCLHFLQTRLASRCLLWTAQGREIRGQTCLRVLSRDRAWVYSWSTAAPQDNLHPTCIGISVER